MCRKIYWCYTFVLTLLDISLNTKLTAQGESHGVTIHESLVEGITFQEWGKESGADSVDGNSENVEGITLEPRALRFGRSALAAPHSRTVTLTNTANTTLHLASVAGTTPDFHASFFQSKTLAPQSNTTFSVVYLGRQEGPVSAHLYIHTSLGVHKYPVSAVGVASEYAVWPLLGVRVPLNATLEPELRLHNPTDATVQVHEIYSTGSWVRLRLPGGGERAHRDLWAVPPRSSRTLVLLRLAPHAHPNVHTLQQPLIAYIRIKANIPGGGLVVAVEARSVPAGEHARPLHVMLGSRGTGDPPHTVELVVANSGDSPVALTGGVRGVGCWRTAPPPPPLPCAAPAPEPEPHMHNGGTMSGAHLSLERTHLAPHQDFTHVGRLTLNYAELWSLTSQPTHMNGASTNWEKEKGAPGESEEAWCAGCVRLGRATVPFSMRLLPGALRFTPEHLDIVTAAEDAMREREVVARNEFRHALRIDALHLPPEVADYFHLVEHTPLVLQPGTAAPLLRLHLRSPPPVAFALTSTLTVHTNLSQYSVPVRIYSGQLIFEWDWVNATSESLELGAVGTSWTRRVGARLHNPAPAPLCLSALTATLPGAAATLALSPPNTKCIEPGSWAQAWLTVVAPAREASLRGVVLANTTLASTAVRLALRVRAGHVRAHDVKLPPAAPYAGSSAEVEVESSMSARMRVTGLGTQVPDPALSFEWEDGLVTAGLQRVARVSVRPERRCEPACYTGLDIQTNDGAAWLRRSEGDAYEEAALLEDVALLQARLARFAQHAAHHDNFTLQLHTTEVLQIAVSGSATLHWPRLVKADAAGGAAPLVGVTRSAPFQITVHNAAHVPLLLHVLLDTYRSRVTLPSSAGGDTAFCTPEKCKWSREAFTLSGWRVSRGAARVWPEGEARHAHAHSGSALPMLLLGPHAEIVISVTFTPPDAATFATYLYLKNNLTILEGVQLYGQGEYPSFDIAGKKPGSSSPFVFEVKDCTWGLTSANARGGASMVSRRLVARNPGRVGVELSGWSVARGGCAERGFRVSPCAPIALPPNATSPLLISFAPDYTLSRVTATLHLHTDLGPAEYVLMATVPAKLISRCATTVPRPAWEPPLRSLCIVFSFACLALLLAVATLDSERLLRRARASRPPPDTHTPLDLNDIVHDPPPAPPPARPPPRRRRSARRPLPPMDPRAERKAFERWRAEVLRREEDSSRSSEEADLDIDEIATNTPYDRAVETPLDEKYELNDTIVDEEPEDTEPAPIDEDGGSTGSDASTPLEDRDDADEPYGGDVEPDPRDDSPVEGPTTAPATEPILRPLVRTPPIETNSRSTKSRRDNGESNRRTEKIRHTTETGERRGTPARHHTRKERIPKRRNERAVPTPPPRSPAPVINGGAETAETRGTVRWGETWSSVVAARAGSGPTLAPIGSDVRRREPERASDNSLFYFNGSTDTAARPEAEYAWRAPLAAERPAFVAPRDFMDEQHTQHTLSSGSVGGVGSGYGVGMGSVWGAGAWGTWDSGPLRPPPGFAPPSPPTQRTYDPFRSLASIWAPAPHEWRPASNPTAPPTPTRDRDDPM